MGPGAARRTEVGLVGPEWFPSSDVGRVCRSHPGEAGSQGVGMGG